MNGDDIAKLRRLDAQATPGPWTWEAVGEKDNSWCLGTEYEGEVVDFVAQSGTCENQADPDLICTMRNAFPALLDVLEERESAMDIRIREGYDNTVADCWRAKLAEVEAERDAYRSKLADLVAYTKNADLNQSAIHARHAAIDLLRGEQRTAQASKGARP